MKEILEKLQYLLDTYNNERTKKSEGLDSDYILFLAGKSKGINEAISIVKEGFVELPYLGKATAKPNDTPCYLKDPRIAIHNKALEQELFDKLNTARFQYPTRTVIKETVYSTEDFQKANEKPSLLKELEEEIRKGYADSATPSQQEKHEWHKESLQEILRNRFKRAKRGW